MVRLNTKDEDRKDIRMLAVGVPLEDHCSQKGANEDTDDYVACMDKNPDTLTVDPNWLGE
jgi:hypothetical protein